MTTPEDQDAATRERITKHMNADHHDAVRRYVEAYASKSTFQSRDAQMTDINLAHIKFSCGGQEGVIPLDPPMESLRESRERLAQMDKDAQEALGRSDITVNVFIPPTAKLGHLWNFTQCLLALILLPRPANFRPGSVLYNGLLYRVPSFAAFVAQIGWIVFAIMLPLHTTEAGLMGKKLMRHGCSPADAVWWKWVGACFVEGITSSWRLDGLIEKKRRENEAKKH